MRPIFVWLIVVTMGIFALFYGQYSLEKRFQEHWHYVPKNYNVELAQRKLSDKVTYNLTKPKPKWQSNQGSYCFWSSCWSR